MQNGIHIRDQLPKKTLETKFGFNHKTSKIRVSFFTKTRLYSQIGTVILVVNGLNFVISDPENL